MIASVLAMRRRSVWEAADTGILLWKKNFSYIIPFFALPVALASAALLLIPEEYRWVSWLCLWWLKPLFDRFCLQVVSVRFFKMNSETGFRMIFRGMARNFFPYLPGDLLWRRFSPFRCSAMPLRLMERLKRRQYLQRNKALDAGGINFSAVLTCLGLPLEAILLGGEIVFILVLCNIFLPEFSVFYELGPEVIFLAIYIMYTVNYILAESLYVCMGFGVYINSRVEVEGWDIELLFKKFAGRIQSSLKIIVLVFGIFMLAPLYAGDSEPNEHADKYYFPPDIMSPEKLLLDDLEEILSSDDFGGYKPSWNVSLKNNNKKPAPVTESSPLFSELREILAKSLRIFIIVIFAVSLVIIPARLLKSRKQTARYPAVNIFSGPLVSKGNPDVFFQNAETCFRQGLIREAWAACLCGVLNAFNIYPGIVFPPEITEYGCLDLVRSRLGYSSPVTGGFGNLIRDWVLLAYGAKIPPEENFYRALEYGRSLNITANPEEAPPA